MLEKSFDKHEKECPRQIDKDMLCFCVCKVTFATLISIFFYYNSNSPKHLFCYLSLSYFC